MALWNRSKRRMRTHMAVTFDFWDTLVVDDSDEKVRAEQGMASKPQAREDLFVREVLLHTPDRHEADVRAAFRVANTEFERMWKLKHQTPPVVDRVRRAFEIVGVAPTQGMESVVRDIERMEVLVPPVLAPGVFDCLTALKGKYPLGIVSDAIVTPGRGLRKILKHHGILQFFDALIFSDEAGVSKPDPHVFDLAAEGLKVNARQLIHIGDREANDVVGPHNVGARAVLYTGVVDRRTQHTHADAVCADFGELPSIIERLDHGGETP